MSERTAEEEARAAGLAYVADDCPGIRRRRCGRGFTYLLPDGETLRDDDVRERIDGLAIPPAWTEVWICRDPAGHLQATGRDEEGRKQYLYHPSWVEIRHTAKFRRVQALGERLPTVRRCVGRHLAGAGLDRSRVLAAVVRLLDRTGLRIGTPEYAARNGTHGVTTLRRKHARVRGSRVTLEFRGKAGSDVRVALDDPALAPVLKEALETPGWRVFKFIDESGERTEVGPELVNCYISTVADGPFTAKDFRTWFATVSVLEELRETAGDEETDWTRAWLDAVDAVAEALGNTRAVVRESYLPPGLEELVMEGGLPPRLEELASRIDALSAPGRRRGEAAALAVVESLLGD
jgi:DNA topoisomerase-1